ncbi:uncharacterized protein LOC101860523 [Aplysia californica]|uniref:Uncharacterized protein LOC101860523 n=1 Tax=Aplysia californica TaxID=6500 RepID=A0ABM0K2F1_APLCA|nr:uncharacterized protein LOC101860523 [Aplysia californica]
MPVLHLREAEPFLASDQTVKMEESLQTHFKKETTYGMDRVSQRRISRRTTSLIVSDTFILILEMLQLLALIQSMSLRWAWPETWIKYVNFILIFNLDAWDFVKVQSGAYKQLQAAETLSSKIPVSYNYILLAWGLFVLVSAAIFLTVFLILQRRQPPYLMVHKAKMERVFLIMAQILTLPVGTVMFRLFHCAGNGKMAVFDDITCHEGLYWAYFIPAVFGIIAVFGVIPAWMVYRIRSQKLAASTAHHENYMKLKEVEYMAGLDVVWAVQGFNLFSSFRLPAAFYRPVVVLAKLIILIIFSAAYTSIYNQSVALAVILCLYALSVPLVRPFRVMSFNVALGLSLGCLAGDAVFGAVIASVTPATVESPWLVEPYSYWILIGINIIMVLTLISWIVYMISRHCCCRTCYPNDPLWPILTSYGYEVEGMETYKFMAAVLRGRAVLDSCIRAPTVFAPVHQLARQIEIINAFCREAEKTGDSLHTTLLQLLDDMTDVFRRLEPVSLFAETVKENIRQNAARFVEMMPAFAQRLAQRDYDLILAHPVRKRLLFKMSMIGMFISGSRKKPVTDTLTQRALLNIWEEAPDVVEPKHEVEYGEELYPEPLTGPDAETLYLSGTVDRPLELMELDDSEEEESLAVFLGRVPPVLMMKDEQSRSGSLASLRAASALEETGPGLQEPVAGTHQQQDTPEVSGHLDGKAELNTELDQGFTNPGFIPDSEIGFEQGSSGSVKSNEEGRGDQALISETFGDGRVGAETAGPSDKHGLGLQELEQEGNIGNSEGVEEVMTAEEEMAADNEMGGDQSGESGRLEGNEMGQGSLTEQAEPSLASSGDQQGSGEGLIHLKDHTAGESSTDR